MLVDRLSPTSFSFLFPFFSYFFIPFSFLFLFFLRYTFLNFVLKKQLRERSNEVFYFFSLSTFSPSYPPLPLRPKSVRVLTLLNNTKKQKRKNILASTNIQICVLINLFTKMKRERGRGREQKGREGGQRLQERRVRRF